MKVRSGFVSNSSSSSFICEICGEGDVYSDCCSVSDFNMCYCENGHLICLEHLLNDNEFPEEELDDLDYGYDTKPESSCPICNFECYSTSEAVRYLIETKGISKDEVFAKVKESNKRRKKLYDQEYIKYVFDKFQMTEDSYLAELKSKFKTYREFIGRDRK